MTVTMSLPLFSGREATVRAAQRLAPELMPQRMPSSFAARRASANESSAVARSISSTILRLSTPGTNPAPIPCILCGPFAPPERTGLSAGSTAIALTDGLRPFSAEPTPVMVPPVPTPATKMSIFPSVSRQISSAVVLRWNAGLAGFSNC